LKIRTLDAITSVEEKKKPFMKKISLFLLAFIGLTVGDLNHADAGSAVALAPHNHLATSYGGPIEIVKQKVLDVARRRYGATARIIASSDVTGYGAIAVALLPNGRGTIIGVALGRRSATEADSLAIEQCIKGGGTNPRVKWGFRG
jgi:hypothetical protein